MLSQSCFNVGCPNADPTLAQRFVFNVLREYHVFLDGTIQGKVDFMLHYCYDPAADSFRDLPMNACKEINEAFDLEVWGVLLKSTFARADGVICTTDQSESNHPMGELNPSETQVSGRLGMSGGISPRHAQNPLSGERRKTLSITHHALSPPPSHHHLYIIHLIN